MRVTTNVKREKVSHVICSFIFTTNIMSKSFKTVKDIVDILEDGGPITNLQTAIFHCDPVGTVCMTHGAFTWVTGKPAPKDSGSSIYISVSELLLFGLPAKFEHSIIGALRLMRNCKTKQIQFGLCKVVLDSALMDRKKFCKIYFTLTNENETPGEKTELLAQLWYENGWRFVLALREED